MHDFVCLVANVTGCATINRSIDDIQTGCDCNRLLSYFIVNTIIKITTATGP